MQPPSQQYPGVDLHDLYEPCDEASEVIGYIPHCSQCGEDASGFAPPNFWWCPPCNLEWQP